MVTHRTPGVYFEGLDAQARAYGPVRTDVAGFVGFAARGPLHQPVRIESWTQFVSQFGGLIPQAYLAYAVKGFFANGGQTCYVVRVADPDRVRWASLALSFRAGQPILLLTAASPGTWGQEVVVTAWLTASDRFSLLLSTGGSTQEIWRDLSLDHGDPRYALRLLNGDSARNLPGSSLVQAPPDQQLTGQQQAALTLRTDAQVARLKGGADGLGTVTPAHLSGAGAPPNQPWGLATLEDVPDVAIVAMPDIMPVDRHDIEWPKRPPRECDPNKRPSPLPPPLVPITSAWPPRFNPEEIKELQRQLVGHCEKLKDRVAILDSPSGEMMPEAVRGWRNQFNTSYAAAYYPWLCMTDPLGGLRPVPPSGHIAGIYARVENRTGPHKPPANELIEDAPDVSLAVGHVLYGDFNDYQINVLRTAPGRGLRVLGERTLSNDAIWRYVNVRRLLISIERTIDRYTQWIVFEPNNRDLWRDMDRVIRLFLDDIWHRGWLDGDAAEQAYTVQCNASTNPPEERDLGRVVTAIGVLPPWPAEFVVVRIGKTEAGTQVLEGASG